MCIEMCLTNQPYLSQSYHAFSLSLEQNCVYFDIWYKLETGKIDTHCSGGRMLLLDSFVECIYGFVRRTSGGWLVLLDGFLEVGCF
jgi:hypothetical protein